jgi:hypothetical protein
MFQEALNYFGGLLGFGSNPPMPPAGPEYYAEGMAAGAATNPPQAPGIDPFSRFTPEQRQALGIAALGDMFATAGGKKATGMQSLLNSFDALEGRGKISDLMPQAQQQRQFAQAPGLSPMPAPQAPQTRSPMAMNLPRPVAIRVPSLLGR